ncbi:nucleotidyl transferase AbiEii/AbiGii toxin family protein [Cupriavidus sp. TMH.W2]|uniref:nucleotidyl transferase AbiEii/AbiGii toxin family protein n=1 Tax=Cupriavidus sp. TMH.W2 TaxID=3434465 RepID=UPI003D783AE0
MPVPLRFDKLPPATARLLELMAAECEPLQRFALIGGTALTLHLGHRISEDLDFSFPGRHLDPGDVIEILEALNRHGVTCVDIMPSAAKEDALNDGDDLDEIQRNFMATGGPLGEAEVKLTFVIHGAYRKDTEYLARVMPQCLPYGNVRIATVPIVFASKCVALSERIKSRDLFDLWWLTHRYTPAWPVEEIFHAVREFRPQPYEDTRARLLSYPIADTDEGFATLMDEPITVDTIRADFRREVEQMEERQMIPALQDRVRQPDDTPEP